jgi:hypothetical protein
MMVYDVHDILYDMYGLYDGSMIDDINDVVMQGGC